MFVPRGRKSRPVREKQGKTPMNDSQMQEAPRAATEHTTKELILHTNDAFQDRAFPCALSSNHNQLRKLQGLHSNRAEDVL